MGGYNAVGCFYDKCPEFRNGYRCDYATAFKQTTQEDSDKQRIRVVCGHILDVVSSEVSEEEGVNAVLGGIIPTLTDEITDIKR